jgi:putative hemolysin
MESHSVSSLLGDLGIVALLVALGGLFVAAEIALISLRDSQIKQIALKGKRGAKVAQLASNPNRLLGAVQIGVTFS